ncbi:MAG: hypothetical protein D6714_13590 [Bacteroidetes bacterium]|nr:MAG: hypothetical protein D6714_13590 [Bacteroidota bacterium]
MEKVRNIFEEFESNALSSEESKSIRGGYKQSFGGAGSTGFISWDDIEIREEDHRIVYSFVPTAHKISRGNFGV